MLEAIKMYFLSFVITISVALYLQSKILNKKIKLNLYIFIISFIFIMLCILNYYFVDSLLRILTNTILLTIYSILVFKENLYKCLVVSFLEQLLLFISELFYMILFFAFSINLLNLSQSNFMGSLIVNLIVSLTSILIYNFKCIKLIINQLLSIFEKINNIVIYIILFIFVVTLSFFLNSNYVSSNSFNKALINTLFIILYSIIMFIFLFEKNKNIIYIKENKILIDNLNEYEKMLDYQRVNNHENKNQLLVIKSMIEKKDKKLMEYINEIIKEKREDNEIVYNKAKRIPSGGLQGLIYQKMLLMQENNVEVNLDINSQVRKIDLENMSPKMNYDICRIVGIIIDNAIEETTKFNKKDREIIISMYVDDMFIIEVSNRIKDDLDINKIYEKGYTSKEKGHGYGLSLLKKIVDENDNIINEVKIVNNIFTQVIKIKM